MWRQNTFPVAARDSPISSIIIMLFDNFLFFFLQGKSDSDHSISDEEDLDGDLRENCVSLAGNTLKEEAWELQSRLDMLRGMNAQSCGNRIRNLASEKKTNVNVDELERSDFPDEGTFFFSPRKGSAHDSKDELDSDDEDKYALLEYSIMSNDRKFDKGNDLRGFGREKQAEACTWSLVNEEAETLINLNENALSSHSAHSKGTKSRKGIRGKSKPKFAFHFQSLKDGLNQPFISKDTNPITFKVDDGPERSETIENKNLENLSPASHEEFCGENVNLSEIKPVEDEALNHGFVDHSMAELLDGLQDKNIQPRGNPKWYSRTKSRRGHIVMKRSMSLLGDRIIDDEDQPELMASGSSSEDETDHQNINLAGLEMKKQTITDRFQEALAATSVSDEGVIFAAAEPSGIGLFRKLQQVMQTEKERDTEFLKKLQMGASPNSEPCSIVVKILSRYFDAKLIVCQCTFGENIKVVLNFRPSFI
ncbi:KINETOCHORE PROTEIN [Salix koriyanagi]|uniref:KINETOCHORE PROTEIN n=1 Tax=Salix koriyanagi TaxID=2511006 RepID=A0A9Q0TF16_9ROSI|nr:KINETOCHORE PROTEIN [Salix koriyanagi]